MRKWLGFWLLGLIWGSSFLLIRIAVEDLNQFEVVFIRTAIAAVGLNALLLLRGKRLPADRRRLASLVVIGLGNNAIPFILITWGEISVESGLASVLQATASLFSLVIAHFAFADERINVQKIVGLAAGFLGIIVLASRSWVDGQIVTSSLAGQMAIVLASLFYAIFTVYSKKVIRNQLEPLVVASGTMASAAVASGLLTFGAPLVGGDAPTMFQGGVSATVWVAVIVLGLLNTFVAYLIFYWLVQELGAARTAMVTYVVPVVGLILGVLVLNEQLDSRLILGAAMIFMGIGIVNLRWRRGNALREAAA